MHDLLRFDFTIQTLAQHFFSNAEDKEDAVQEAYLKLHSMTLPDIENQTGWVYRVVANLFIDIYNKNRKLRDLDQHASIGEAIDNNCPLSYTERVAEETELGRRIEDLPIDLFTVARMYYLDGLSYTLIAEELSIPEGTVASRLNTVRKYLTGND